jgi:hypothetical protein
MDLRRQLLPEFAGVEKMSPTYGSPRSRRWRGTMHIRPIKNDLSEVLVQPKMQKYQHRHCKRSAAIYAFVRRNWIAASSRYLQMK